MAHTSRAELIDNLPMLTELGLWSLFGRDAAEILLDEAASSNGGPEWVPRARRLRHLEYAPIFSAFVRDDPRHIALAIGATVETFVVRLSARAEPTTTLHYAREVAHELAQLRQTVSLRNFVIEDREMATEESRLEELEPESVAISVFLELKCCTTAYGPKIPIRVALFDIGRRELVRSFG